MTPLWQIYVTAVLLSPRNRANGLWMLSQVRCSIAGLPQIWLEHRSTRWISQELALNQEKIPDLIVLFSVCKHQYCLDILILVYSAHEVLYLLQTIKKVDWMGAALFVTSITSSIMVIYYVWRIGNSDCKPLAKIEKDGLSHLRSPWQTIKPLQFGALALLAWVIYEWYVPK